MENNCYPFVNIPLPYDDSALEPYIDEQTMRLHHDKHLQTYIDNLNSALEQNPRLQRLTLEQLIRTANCFSEPLKASIQHNAGGVYNHRFFFGVLSRLFRVCRTIDFCAILTDFSAVTMLLKNV